MVLARWQATIVDDAGNVQDAASVEVRAETGGTPLAPVYSDRDGLVGIANPLTADSEGFVGFHVAGGAYQIIATKGSFSRTWRYVGIGTLSERDVDSDLDAIAALSTDTFGRGLLELTDQVEAQSYLGMRERLTANRTYYVRSDGSDSNTGLVDSAGGAFLTIQHAYNVIADTIDCAGFSPIIQVKNGTFTAGLDVTKPIVGAGTLFLVGNVSDPTQVLLTVTNAHCILNRIAGLIVDIGGFTLRTTTAGNCVWAYRGGMINVSGAVRMSTSAGDHFTSTEGGLIEILANYTISGSAVNHWHAYDLGKIICQNKTITFTGGQAFSGNFAGNAQAAHYVDGCTFAGTGPTGSRYLVHKNGVIDTNGGGATYLPGNSTNGTATGGQYI